MANVKKRVMEHLEELSARMTAPVASLEKPPPRKEHIINVEALLEDAPRPEDPVEVLYRKCGEQDLTEFLISRRKELNKRRKVDLQQN